MATWPPWSSVGNPAPPPQKLNRGRYNIKTGVRSFLPNVFWNLCWSGAGFPTSTESEKTPTKHKIMFCGTLPKKSGADAGSMQHEPLRASSKHTCTQQADQSAAQHNKSKPSPAQPSQGKQSRSSAKPSQACEQAIQNTRGQKRNPSDRLIISDPSV